MEDNNPYDFPVSNGPCLRCKKQNTFVIGATCLECLTDEEKRVYGVDQDPIEE